MSPLRRWGQSNCLPSLALLQHFVKNLKQILFDRETFTTRFCLLQLCTFKGLFPVKAKKNCLVSFCLLSKRSALTLNSMIRSKLHLPVLLHQSLFPIQPAQLFFRKPPYLRYLSSESIKLLPVSLTFHTEAESPFLLQ